MKRAFVLLVGIGLSSSALSAQAVAGRPLVLLGGGIAGQYNGGGDLGSPGLSATVGIQWPVSPAVGLRLEAQGVDYGSQVLPAVAAARGSAERIGAVSALVSWAPRPDARLHLLGGGALVRASITGESGTATTGAAVLGIGLKIARSADLEGQYLHLARQMGETRSVFAARVLLRL